MDVSHKLKIRCSFLFDLSKNRTYQEFKFSYTHCPNLNLILYYYIQLPTTVITWVPIYHAEESVPLFCNAGKFKLTRGQFKIWTYSGRIWQVNSAPPHCHSFNSNWYSSMITHPNTNHLNVTYLSVLISQEAAFPTWRGMLDCLFNCYNQLDHSKRLD